MKINELDQTSEIPNLIPNHNDPLFFKRFYQLFFNFL